jgi:D-xylose transport system permease protein
VSTTAQEPVGFEPEKTEFSLGEMLQRLGRGELGSVRVIIAIAVIWTIFQLANDRFLSAVNLTNLSLQIAAVATISIGVVLVLLLGEIDLSIGAVSGLAAGVMAVLSVKEGWNPELSIVAALVVGLLIGALQGFFITAFRLPSFVVTLAGLLAWPGFLLLVLGETGTVPLPPSTITDLTGTFFDPAVGWALAAAVVGAYIGSVLLGRARRMRAGLPVPPLIQALIAPVLIAAGTFSAVAILNADRGVPLAVVIVVGLTAIFSFITERTRFGRHIFAVGGNAEAARRAGIRVNQIRMAVFVLGSTLAAFGGVLAASRLLAVNQQSGTGEVLLFAIAGPVIAGTSLFGGRGFVWSALLGAIVIGSISNGMDLLGLESDIKFIITGAVLLAAVTIDAATRLRRQTAT